MIKARDPLAYLFWVLIAFPYHFLVTSSLSDGKSWRFDCLGVNVLAVFLTAAVGVGGFSVLSGFSILRRLRPFAGAIIGLSVPLLLLLALPGDSRMVTDGIFFWNVIAGFITGALLERSSFEAGPAISERNFGWISAALWVVVLRISELTFLSHFRWADEHFFQELLTFVPVLLWFPYASKLLFRKAVGTTTILVVWSIICAVAVEIASAVSISPIVMLARGSGGTGYAIDVLIGVNGSAIVWGALMGYLLSKYRIRPPQPEIDPNLVSEA